ncbi:MAG: hypothetical protein U5J95_02495 [Balneolaceae bacterium]|nr:hypothetical protein [Balneolaceae bacterium]
MKKFNRNNFITSTTNQIFFIVLTFCLCFSLSVDLNAQDSGNYPDNTRYSQETYEEYKEALGNLISAIEGTHNFRWEVSNKMHKRTFLYHEKIKYKREKTTKSHPARIASFETEFHELITKMKEDNSFINTEKLDQVPPSFEFNDSPKQYSIDFDKD